MTASNNRGPSRASSVLYFVSRYYGLTPETVLKKKRGNEPLIAAVGLSREKLKYSYARIGRAYGRSVTAVVWLYGQYDGEARKMGEYIWSKNA